jgi:transcriptional antiterminator Rof (Rho-off)
MHEADGTAAYHPIDCSLHDHIEAAAVQGRVVRIVYESDAGVTSIEDRITDWFVKDGAEYLKTAGEVTLRLDQLISLDRVEFRSL